MDRTGHVVVTGGAGFIGTHVCRALTGLGFDVVVVDDLSTGSEDNLAALPVDLVEGSILDPALLASAFRGASSAVHLAARPSVSRSIDDPIGSHEANATGTLNVLEAARRVGAHTIIASSSSVYGASAELPKRESSRPCPLSPYAASKLAAESYARAYSHCYLLPVLVFRFFNVFGPLQRSDHAYAAVIPQFISAALSHRALSIHGDGRQSRDFTYVGTVAQAISMVVVERLTHDGPVNLAFGTRLSILDLVAKLEALLGTDLTRSHVEPRAGDVRDSQADSARLRALLPTLRPEDFDLALKMTVDWTTTSSAAVDRPLP